LLPTLFAFTMVRIDAALLWVSTLFQERRTMPTLIYIADPMCSWCYGFGPELALLKQGLPETPVEIVLGGLRTHNKEPMTAEFKNTLLSHWKQVGESSGLSFSEAALAQHDFIYDTESACRAVVTARVLAPDAVLPVFHAIQHAFYAEGQNITDAKVLADVSAAALNESGYDITPDAFLAKWSDPAMIDATSEDFKQTQQWGILGFPTLVLERNGRLDLVTSGYARTEALVEKMQGIIDHPS
jgi:putative protein-disulfide isomerase